MNDLRDSLRRDDPLTREAAPDDIELDAMRRRVLASARAPRPRPRLSPVFMASAAALTCVAAGAVMHLSARHDAASPRSARSEAQEPGEQRRDLRRVYFETSSGVQVIWQFETE